MLSGIGRRKGDTELVIALAAGETVRDAAKAAGISERTAFRRIQEQGFQQEVANTRTLMVSRAVGMLADAATNAVSTLRFLLGAESENVQLGAARAILEAGPRLREAEELAQRIAALEAHLEPAQSTNSRGRSQWSG